MTVEYYIEEHSNADIGKVQFVLYAKGFPYAIWTHTDLDKVKERLELIKEIGFKAYMERITTKKTVVHTVQLEDQFMAELVKEEEPEELEVAPEIKYGKKPEDENIEYRTN